MNDIALDCYYSLSSPWAYFAGPRLQDIVRRHPGVKLTFKPYDFQSVVPANGGIPIRTRPGPRRRYHQEELARWSEYLAMPIVLLIPTRQPLTPGAEVRVFARGADGWHLVPRLCR